MRNGKSGEKDFNISDVLQTSGDIWPLTTNVRYVYQSFKCRRKIIFIGFGEVFSRRQFEISFQMKKKMLETAEPIFYQK